MTTTQEKVIEATTLATIKQGPQLVVPVAISVGAVLGAVAGAVIARNQEVRPGFMSGWSGYMTVVGAALGWAMCAPLVARPRRTGTRSRS